jgi:hypothetical protein
MMSIPQHRSDEDDPSTRSPPLPLTSHDYRNDPDQKTYARQDDEHGQRDRYQLHSDVKGDSNNEHDDSPAD